MGPLLALFILAAPPLRGAPAVPPRETGEFRIVVGGTDVGSEQFEIREAGGKILSSSVVEFRNPEAANQRVRFETSLEMDSNLVPTRYQLKSEVDGKKGTITGTFSGNQAMFEYASDAGARKAGLLTGKEFTLLDTNVFHHFSFIARLFLARAAAKDHRFEVLIPQETDSGIVTVTDRGKENIVVRGRRKQVRRLLLDTGVLQIELRVDGAGAVQRISVPSKAVEVERSR